MGKCLFIFIGSVVGVRFFSFQQTIDTRHPTPLLNRAFHLKLTPIAALTPSPSPKLGRGESEGSQKGVGKEGRDDKRTITRFLSEVLTTPNVRIGFASDAVEAGACG